MLRIIESIQSYLKHLNESLADCASAVTELSNNVQTIADAMPYITRKLGEIADEQTKQGEAWGRYVQDQAKHEGNLERFKSEVREKLKAVNGKRE